MWEGAWFIHEITFREQELNWLFEKYKRLENNPLYGILVHPHTPPMHTSQNHSKVKY